MSKESPSIRLRHFLSEHWPVRAVRILLGKRARRAFPPHPFDRLHRVDTGGLIYAESLPSGHPHDKQSEGYYATAPSLFRGVIEAWHATLSGARSNLNGTTFFDVGCGKGRVLLLASEYPFRSIVGVELHPGLAQTARSNLKTWMRTPRACADITIVASDVFRIPIPDGPVVIYLFNSFGRELLHMLLDRLSAVSATRCDPIDLLYVHPEYGDLVMQTPRMELLADEEFPFSAEDAAADVFGVNFDRCCIYRLPGIMKAERLA